MIFETTGETKMEGSFIVWWDKVILSLIQDVGLVDQHINLNLKHGHVLFLDHGLMKILCLGLITGRGVNVGAKIYDF